MFGAAEAVHYVLDVPSGPLTTVLAPSSRTPPSTARGPASPPSSSASPSVGTRHSGRPSRAWGSAIAAVLHGVSNWLVGSWAWVAVAGVSALLLLAYSTVGVPTGSPLRGRPREIDPPTGPIAFRGPDGRWWA